MAVRRRTLLGVMLAGAGTLATTGCLSDTAPDTDTAPDAGTRHSSPGRTSGATPETEDKPAPGNAERTDRITLVATGDVLLHERLWTTAKRDGRNGDWDFAPVMSSVKPLVQDADIAVCHLETPLAPLGGPYRGYPLFQGPPQIAAALKQTGYDVCTTASNHSFDGGGAGVDRTLTTLERAGLRHAGTARTPAEAETPTIVDVRGVKVAVLSYAYGFNGLPYPDGDTWRAGTIDVPAIKAMAKKARGLGAEIVVVSCHWGTEYSSRLNDQQRAVAPQLLADSNIDLLVGHHAHVVQPMQRINGKWVAYGLGNLIAAHREPTSPKAEGLLVRFTFERSGHRWTTAAAEYAPLLMTDALPVRVLDVRRELQKPGARRTRLERAERRTTATVTSLGSDGLKML